MWILLIIILTALLFWLPTVSYYDGPKSDHFDGKNFHNYENKDRSFSEVFDWWKTRKPAAWPEKVDVHPADVPLRSDLLLITYVNHSTFLIQWGNVNILTDPIWSERASPFSFIGPKRHHVPGIDFDKLPPIDFVLVSHNHYDHMDLDTLKRLDDKFHPTFITGLGNDTYLKKNGIANVIGLDWWESNFGITYVPAEHFSARWPWDRNKMLWGGFIIQHEGETLYFAGDTAYGKFFQEIHKRFGSPKVAFLPIGAYEPRWFMKPAHMNPEEALNAQLDLGAKTAIAMHWGTFQLADEARDQPVIDLRQARTNERFLVLEPGQSINVLELNEDN